MIYILNHGKIMKKSDIERVMMMSDGVSDLVSYRNMLSMIKNRSRARDFVRKANWDPDVPEDLKEKGMKSKDNITMASIEVEDGNQMGGYR